MRIHGKIAGNLLFLSKEMLLIEMELFSIKREEKHSKQITNGDKPTQQKIILILRFDIGKWIQFAHFQPLSLHMLKSEELPPLKNLIRLARETIMSFYKFNEIQIHKVSCKENSFSINDSYRFRNS